MKKNKKFSIILMTINIFLLITSAIIFPNVSFSQEPQVNLFLQKTENRSNLLKAIFYNPYDLNGIKIAQKDKKIVAPDQKKKSEDDSSKREDKIVNLVESGDSYLLYIELKDYEQKIQISVYNLLAKKVLDVYEGLPYKDPSAYYEIRTNKLPNGVYMCVVQGKSFRLIEKFIVSR